MQAHLSPERVHCGHNHLSPFYLPREIPQVFLTVVHTHPKANMAEAASSIANLAHRLPSICPDAPHLILGDFNTCGLNHHLSHLYQYVECPTGHGGTLNLCYSTMKGAYNSFPLTQLGSSDHNCVLMLQCISRPSRRGKVNAKRWLPGQRALDESELSDKGG